MSQVATSTPGYTPIPTTAISGAGTTTGTWLPIQRMRLISYQAEWTGTLAGTFSFEVTNYKPDPATGVPLSTAKATALTLPSTFAAGNPAGSAGDFIFEFSDMGEAFIRPKFTYASGSGNLTVTANGKGV